MDKQPSPTLADQPLRSWQRLATALKSISPAGYLRFGLVLVAFVGLFWIIWQARSSLLPFFVGGMVAYILLPLVNSLDRVMPRFLAVFIALTLLLALLGFLFYILVPPLVKQVPNFIQLIPDRAEIQAIVSRLQGLVQTLPPPAQEAVIKAVQNISLTLRQYLDQSLGAIAGNLVAFLIRIFNSIGFILGFLIVPAWLLSVLKDQHRGVHALNRILPAPVQEDFWAVARILDRPLRAFVNGQFLLALVTGVAVYFSFALLEKLGWPTIQYKVPLALWASVFELIPQIGPYLGAIPAVVGGFARGPQIGLAVIALYIVLHYLINQLVGLRIGNRIDFIHPAILLVVIVAVSQLGFLWILLTAPLISMITDLFRYLYGRLSDPPRPAGVLPDQQIPEAPTAQETTAYRVPLVYRRTRQARRS